MKTLKYNIMETCEMIAKGTVDLQDERVKEAEQFLAELASTEDGKQLIAETIAIYLDKNFNKFDIAPYIFTYRNFNLGDKPEFRLKKKGIKAYWIAPNSYTPKSRNYQEVLGMEFDSLSVAPECLLDELKAGRIQGFAELIGDAQDAMVNAIVGKVFTLLGQVYTEEKNPEQFQQDTTNLSQASLDKAIDTIFYKTGVRPTVIGDMMLTNQIMGFTGYSDTTKDSILRTGTIGVYRGATILPLPEVKDPATDKILVPKNRLYIVSKKLGYAGTYGNAKAGQETNINDWSWFAKIDKEWGATVTDPEGMYVIEVV